MKKITSILLLLILLLCILPLPAQALRTLVPGGQVIGLELGNSTVTVADFDAALGQAAQQAGVEKGDRILSIDGRQIGSAQDIRDALNQARTDVRLQLLRSGKTVSLQLTPQITPDGPRLGLLLRQGITGIGTVTYYDPADGSFGTLGHGVSDSGGQLLQLTGGNAYSASVASVRKGASGNPGQLMGALESRQPIGQLWRNCSRGVFGTAGTDWGAEPLEVAEPSQVRTGPATIRSTVAGTSVQEYSVEILKIYPTARQSGRNMLIRVTDPVLLEATGGIVQGMSGSPIIQNGKLIGAVTHVLVNDPTTGYGIFIDNMLDAAA